MLPVFHYGRAMLAVDRVSKPSQTRKLLATQESETKTFFLLNATKEKLHLNTQITLFLRRPKLIRRHFRLSYWNAQITVYQLNTYCDNYFTTSYWCAVCGFIIGISLYPVDHLRWAGIYSIRRLYLALATLLGRKLQSH